MILQSALDAGLRSKVEGTSQKHALSKGAFRARSASFDPANAGRKATLLS
jgi:hypothetical protein